MYHSITFGDKNTYDDWKIVPKERPYFAPPEIKTNYVEIPGASQKLDFSEALTGYPLYGNRTGILDFYILNSIDDVSRKWISIYDEILNYLHNKSLRAVLEDDPYYFYEGRFSVASYSPGSSAGEPRSAIAISYDVGPYKWNIEASTSDEWLWDPFDFQTGVIQESPFKALPITSEWQEISLTNKKLIGYAPFTPIIITDTPDSSGTYGTDIRFINPNLRIDIEKNIPDGSNSLSEIIVYGDDCKFYYKSRSGGGHLTFEFREGRL